MLGTLHATFVLLAIVVGLVTRCSERDGTTKIIMYQILGTSLLAVIDLLGLN